MELAPSPILHVVVAVVGLIACYYDLRWRLLPDWLTIGGMAVGLILAGAVGGWDGALAAGLGMICGLALFWLLWTLGMIGSGDVLLMGACGALLGWPLVIWGVLHSALVGAVIGLGFSLARGHFFRVFKNLWTVIATTFNPRRKRVSLAELPTDELPYGVAIAVGCGWAALLPYVPALRLI
ncbi:MAG: A24 family peptidase [bacterium]